MTKRIYLVLLSCLLCQSANAQITEYQQEFDAFIKTLETQYTYYDQKKEIIDCVKERYRPSLDTISHPFYKILFYENLINELYDSHVILNTNTDQSWRLYSPIYVQERGGQFYISSVFSSQLEIDFPNILNAQLLSFNGQPFANALRDFPTHCHDKTNPEIREWLANKLLAGKRKKPRMLRLKLKDGSETTLDIDAIKFRQYSDLLTATVENNVGYIRINNSLGNEGLVAVFNSTLDGMMGTDALILDLRNTVDGGNTGVAEPIMGRFVAEKTAYQQYGNAEKKNTSFAFPNGQHYAKPVYVLAGRWTGSMGEGMTIGFDGMERGTVIGTELQRLAGGMKTVNFINSTYGFRISFEKMYQLNGALRETFVPGEYVQQQGLATDEFVERALALIEAAKD